MLSSTWWLYRGGFLSPFLSNTRLFFESGIATANSARSAGVAGGFECKVWEVTLCSVDDVFIVPEFLRKLLAGPCCWVPIRWACVISEGKSGVHNKCATRDGTVHGDEVGIVFYAWKGALYIVISGVAVVGWVGYCQVPMACAKFLECVCKMQS